MTNTGTTSADALRYEYSIKDHLGNTRLNFTDKNGDGKVAVTTTTTNEILSESHYYPFGLAMSGPWMDDASARDNQYKYNGKELNEDFGLGWYDYGARWYDASLGRWNVVDPMSEKNYFEGPYVFVHNRPLIYVDPDGQDGIIVIKGSQINITSNVYLYGSGATTAVAAQYQSDINAKWGGTFSAKTSDGKQSFNVNVTVTVGLYENKERNDPFLIEESWNPYNRDNFIEVGAADMRSYVVGGDEGEWRGEGRNGSTLAEDDPAPHEVGHLLGLGDRYTDKNGPNSGWENNIMGDSQNGKVEQRNIDGILQEAMNAYDVWSKDKNNSGKEFRYEINKNNPNNENH